MTVQDGPLTGPEAAMLQSRTVPSVLQLAIVWPFAAKASALMKPSCPLSTARQRYSGPPTNQTRRVLSLPPEASNLPSLEKARASTAP